MTTWQVTTEEGNEEAGSHLPRMQQVNAITLGRMYFHHLDLKRSERLPTTNTFIVVYLIRFQVSQ